MTTKTTDTVINMIAGLLISVFCYTAITKFAGHSKFNFTLQHSPLLKPFAFVLSWAVPAWELVLVACLFFPVTRRIGLLLSLVTMFVFTVYIGYMLVFTQKLPCSCGGIISELKWWQHFILNIFLTLAAWVAYRLISGHTFLLQLSRQSRTPV